jgi:putative Holliday junction resolvase
VIGRVAAVDYGRVRIGLAVCDPLGISARGLPTLQRPAPLEDAAKAVTAVLRAEKVERVVIGVPVRADGSEGDTGREAREFGSALERLLGVPVEYFDETLTSWEAKEDFKAAGKKMDAARRRAGELDRQAARRLLLTWLGHQGI